MLRLRSLSAWKMMIYSTFLKSRSRLLRCLSRCMILSSSFSENVTLFKARTTSRKIKWRSSSEKYWRSKTLSYLSLLRASGTQKQPSKVWSHSWKPLSVQQCLKRSEKCLRVWLDSSTKALTNSDLVLTNWKKISSMLLNNSRMQKFLHWNCN